MRTSAAIVRNRNMNMINLKMD